MEESRALGAPVEEKKSIRVEIEVATVLLGFLFVVNSVLITMPEDVLNSLVMVGLKGFFGFRWFPLINAVSTLAFYCPLFLLISIPFYLVYINMRKLLILVIARTLFGIGIYLTVLLTLLFNSIFMFRLLGKEATIHMNPIFGIILMVASITVIGYIVIIWAKWLASHPTLQKFCRRVLVQLRALTRRKKDKRL